MINRIAGAVQAFDQNVQAVLQLSDLDHGLLDQVIRSLEERDERLYKAGIDSSRMLAGPTLQNIKNIRQNDSLRPGFQALVNQSVVLLASYFSSGISQLFRVAIDAAIEAKPTEHLKNLQLKISVAELAELGSELREVLPDLVADSPGISFQDTKRIARTFEEFFNFEIPKDEITNEITAGLAFRHVLVHNGGIVDRSCTRQIEHAMPRTLRQQIKTGESLNFATREVEVLANAMLIYVQRLATEIEMQLAKKAVLVPDSESNFEKHC
ncbi:MAG: hypothetical protein AB2L12_04525 [Smithellaceae bacterium]